MGTILPSDREFGGVLGIMAQVMMVIDGLDQPDRPA